MRRISDDNIRFGNLLHHAAHSALTLHFLDLSLDLRIAFCLLIFFFDFLFTHAHFALIVPPLIHEIRCCHHNKGKGNAKDHGLAAVKEMDTGCIDICIQVFETFHDRFFQTQINDDHQNRNFSNAFEGLHDTFQREKTFEALKGIQPTELRLHQLRTDQHAGLSEGGNHRANAGHQQDRTCSFDHQQDALHHQVGIQNLYTTRRAAFLHAICHKESNLLCNIARHEEKRSECAHQCHDRDGVLTHEDVTFFSFVPSLFRCRFFGLRTIRQRFIPPLANNSQSSESPVGLCTKQLKHSLHFIQHFQLHLKEKLAKW